MQPRNKQKLADILRYHVVKGSVATGEIKGHEEVPTIDQRMLSADERIGVLNVGEVRVIEPDVKATNGAIRVINRVLVP